MLGAESFDNDQSDRKCAMQKFKAAEGVLINNIRTLHKQFPVEFGEEKHGNYNSNHSLVMRRRFEMSESKIILQSCHKSLIIQSQGHYSKQEVI